jgi:Arc/MetJ-type ribon-helix-helix transcriptional regulator
MPVRSKRYTIRLDGFAFEQVEAIAAHRGVSPADVIRTAIDAWLGTEKRLSASDRRLRRIMEFTQVAMDAIIRENHPDLRDTLVLEADRRMAMHHNVE